MKGNEHLPEDSNLNLDLSLVDKSQRNLVENSSFINQTINSNTTEELFSNLNHKIDDLNFTNVSNVTGNNITANLDFLNSKKNFNKDYFCNARNFYLEGDNVFQQAHNPLLSDNLQGAKTESDLKTLLEKDSYIRKINNQPAKGIKINQPEGNLYGNLLTQETDVFYRGNTPHAEVYDINNPTLYLNYIPNNNKNNVNYGTNFENPPEAGFHRTTSNNFFQKGQLSNIKIIPQNSEDKSPIVVSNYENNMWQNLTTKIPEFSSNNTNDLLNRDQNKIYNFSKNIQNMNIPLVNQQAILGPPSTKVSNTNYLEYTDDQLGENAYFFTKDQCLCRHLQKKVGENHIFAKKIFVILKPKLLELINDSFGNYLVQKLIDCIDDNQIGYIIDSVSDSFFEVCSSQHGTRVIQKLIENLKSINLFNKFNNIFTMHLIRISKDVNANHIIHKYISTIKSPNNNFVYDIIVNNLDLLAMDKHGCCVLQKCLESADEVQKVKYYNNLIESLN